MHDIPVSNLLADSATAGIVRHGQQPGNAFRASTGPRLVLMNSFVEPTNLAEAHVPLRGNDDNRGSEGIVGRIMSFVAHRGLFPDGKVPEHPENIQVPPQQRINASHTHFYTKVRADS